MSEFYPGIISQEPLFYAFCSESMLPVLRFRHWLENAADSGSAMPVHLNLVTVPLASDGGKAS